MGDRRPLSVSLTWWGLGVWVQGAWYGFGMWGEGRV